MRRATYAVCLLLAVLPISQGPAVADERHTCHGRTATIVGTDSEDDLDGTKGADVIVGLGGGDHVWAGPGDIVCGGNGRDLISRAARAFGGRGADAIFGSPDDNVVWGGPGHDDVWLDGGGADLVHGEGGRDMVIASVPDRGHKEPLTMDLSRGRVSSTRHDARLWGFENAMGCGWGAPRIVLIGDAGPNKLVATCTENGVVRGRGGDDHLAGHYFADRLYGGEGDDRLASGGAGNDDTEILDGGGGFDIASFRRNLGGTGPYVEASLENGSARLHAAGSTMDGTVHMFEMEGLRGTRGQDHLTGDGGDNALFGLAGADLLEGAGGTDTIYGGPGSDHCLDGEQLLECESTEAPAVYCAGLIATHAGSEGDDVIYGTRWRDVIAGLGGSDTIHGARGDDVICGGEGADELHGGGGQYNYLYGEAGDDRLVSKGQLFTTLVGGPGNDVIDGTEGAIDIMDLSSAAGPLYLDMTSGTVELDGTDSFAGIERVIGTMSDDVIIGDDLENNLIGGPGADELQGNGGYDRLRGDAGDDLLVGGKDPDWIDGGEGFDRCDGEEESHCEGDP